MSVRIIQGDCRDVLKTLPDESVHCVVTSPPYWGLRDYGVAGQLGLEPTPAEYVAEMVAVFREVRRVLRDDGTVWLNLGSSYAGGGNGGGGSFSSERPGWSVFGGKRPIQSRADALACGTDGKALPDSRVADSACSDLCDGCRAALSIGNASTFLPPASNASPLSQTGRDSEPAGSAGAFQDASPLCAPLSTIVESSSPPSAECSHCANCGVCLSVLRSSTRDARLCARRAENMNGTGLPVSADRNLGKDASGMAWLNYTFKPKDMVPIPWMVAMALQADGWYLRQDIIWSKPNPMPESVTDRCTKAHEYIFLLAKSGRYFFDNDAIKEDCVQDESRPTFRGGSYINNSTFDNAEGWASTDTGNVRRSWKGSEFHTGKTGEHQLGRSQKVRKPAGWDTGPGAHGTVHRDGRAQEVEYAEIDQSKRNKRDVWTVATQPYTEAHFATFPPDLIEPCILAGCPVGGTVLDPFAGAFTTSLVAERLQRNSIAVELNPNYIEMGRRRLMNECPLFTVMEPA